MIRLQTADKRQELLTIREHMGSPRVFGCVRVVNHFSFLSRAFCLLVFVLCLVYPMLPVYLDCSIFIARLDFSNSYIY